MKNFIKALLGLVLFAGILYACSENSDEKETIKLKSDMTPSPVIDNATIGYMNNGTYVPISQALLVGYWKYKLNLPADTNFTNIHVIGGTSETGQLSYTVSGRSENGTVSVTSVLKPVGEPANAMYMMAGGTCSCETTACSWSGCDAQASGSSCYCTSCSGDCKKTSTVETNFARAFAYLKSIGVGK
ncbi:hypothetical protein [Flavobacterium cerinum]|uniref:Lipoprotein n=1 Tax=Flavobacterium cerinum TaxID=2502784 RepID=A0A444HB24_9FLAO|nr:hypothetical protein [Flavobacterium cerinum]RWX00520.1 hypothetical protein EPI11_09605 [Flavobacterium cerinum]